MSIRSNALSFIAAIEREAAKADRRFHISMLRTWADELDAWSDEVVALLSDAEVAKIYHDAYNGRCEGIEAELDSEDYESIDGKEGFDDGIGFAIAAIRTHAGLTPPTQEGGA